MNVCMYNIKCIVTWNDCIKQCYTLYEEGCRFQWVPITVLWKEIEQWGGQIWRLRKSPVQLSETSAFFYQGSNLLRSLALWARPQLREGKFFEWGLSEVFKQYSWAPLYGHPFNMDTLFFFPLFMTLPPAARVNVWPASQNLPPPTSLHFLISFFWLTNIFILGSH